MRRNSWPCPQHASMPPPPATGNFDAAHERQQLSLAPASSCSAAAEDTVKLVASVTVPPPIAAFIEGLGVLAVIAPWQPVERSCCCCFTAATVTALAAVSLL
jgi:hypothetical protein